MRLQEYHLAKYTALGFEVEWKGQKVRPEVEVRVVSGKCEIVQNKEGTLKVLCTPSCADFGVGGYVTAESDLGQIILKAVELNQPLLVRFEKRRKKSVDPTIPMKELKSNLKVAKESISNIVAGIYDFTKKEWLMSRQSHINPSNDPEYFKPIEQLLVVEQEVDVDVFFAKPSKVEITNKEDRAFHLIVFLANIVKASKSQEIDLPMEVAQKLALHLLSVADHLQITMFGIETPNYKDYSHTKARSLVFQFMEINPIPFNTLKVDFPTWKADCQQWGTTVWDWATNN